MPYDLSNQCLFVINEQCTNNTTSQSYSYQLIHEEIQMPKLFWTSMSSTHISLPPTSCLVKSFKLSSVLTMVIYIYLEVYRCIAKYRKESLGKKKKKVHVLMGRFATTSGCVWKQQTISQRKEASNQHQQKDQRSSVFLMPVRASRNLPAPLMIWWPSAYCQVSYRTILRSEKVRNTLIGKILGNFALSNSRQIHQNIKYHFQVKNNNNNLLHVSFWEFSRKTWSNGSTEISTPSRVTKNPAWICGPSYHMLLSDPNELLLIFLYICPLPRCNHLLIRLEVLLKKSFSLSLSVSLTCHYQGQCSGSKCVLKFVYHYLW